MKKTTIFFAIGMLCSLAASAQGFYLKGGLGYGMPVGGRTYNGGWFPYSGSEAAGNSDLKKISFATGYQISAGVGYTMSKTFAFELNGMYNPGKEYNYKATIMNVWTPSGTAVLKLDYNSWARNSVIALPSVVIKTGQKKLSGYVRIGVALPIKTDVDFWGTVTTIYDSGARANSATLYHATIKHKYSLGVAVACGGQYSINTRVKLYGEINLLSLSRYVSSFDEIRAVEDGKNVLISSSQAYTSTGGATSYITYSQPFGSAGIHVGVIFNLSPKPAPVAVPQ